MDVLVSPIITAVLNIIAAMLVSWGILQSKDINMFISLGNNIIASVTTVLVACYSIYKIVDLHKAKIGMPIIQASVKTSNPVSTPDISKQTGIPQNAQQTTSNPTTPSQ